MPTKAFILTKEKRNNNTIVSLVKYDYTGSFVGTTTVEVVHTAPISTVQQFTNNINSRGASELVKLQSGVKINNIITALIPKFNIVNVVSADLQYTILNATKVSEELLSVSVLFEINSPIVTSETKNIILSRPQVENDVTVNLVNTLNALQTEIVNEIDIDNLLPLIPTEFDI